MSEQDMKRRIGELISEATAELGLSRRELARQAGVAVGTLFSFEHGKAWPQATKLVAITDALGWRRRAVQQLLESGKDPALVTLEDVRESSWGEDRPRMVSDLSDEQLLAELTMRVQMKNQELRRHRGGS